MMRWPGSSVPPWAARNARTNATVTAGSLVIRPSATTAPSFVTAATIAIGSTPGTSAPKITPRWQMLPASTGSMSSKEMSRSTSSSAGPRPAIIPVVTHADGQLDLDRRRHPAGERDGGAGLDDPVSVR